MPSKTSPFTPRGFTPDPDRGTRKQESTTGTTDSPWPYGFINDIYRVFHRKSPKPLTVVCGNVDFLYRSGIRRTHTHPGSKRRDYYTVTAETPVPWASVLPTVRLKSSGRPSVILHVRRAHIYVAWLGGDGGVGRGFFLLTNEFQFIFCSSKPGLGRYENVCYPNRLQVISGK